MALPHRLMNRLLLAYGRLSRGATLGVRAMLLREGQIMLVKHTYLPGWYMPGGGVDLGESVGAALEREMREEVGAALTGPAELFSIYRNAAVDRRDHVALYICRDWDIRAAPKLPSLEILATGLFPLDALPPDTTPATLARLGEVLGGAPPSADW